MQRRSLAGIVTVVIVTAACNGTAATTSNSASPNPGVPPTPSIPASLSASVPPGAPAEDIRYANEWPSPNGSLYNGRVAHSSISAANVNSLKVAWSVPLTATGSAGRDFANPVVADGVVYLQDGGSNVMAVKSSNGQVLWKHTYSSADYGPNGLTLAYGRVFGITANGVFALDAATGRQVWYRSNFGGGTVRFNLAPQVANDKVFVATSLTAGGGFIYVLNAGTGAIEWSFQTVVDKTGQQLKATAGGAWDPMLIGPDGSVYAGTGNPYLNQQQAQSNPSRELYTDSLIKLDQATGRLDWYYQAFPDDFHDWDLQVSPILTSAAGRSLVLAAGKGGYVFALDPASGSLLWKTAVGIHNGHDQDDQQALDGTLHLQTPYLIYPGEAGGVETNMAAADGVVYVPVVDLGTTYSAPTVVVGTSNFLAASGEMVAVDLANGKELWSSRLPQAPYGGATVAGDLVFTTTFDGEVIAISRADGAVVWTAHLPAGSNSTLAIVGDTLIAGAGIPLATNQQPAVVAYRLG